MEATWTPAQESRYRLARGLVCAVLACFAAYEFYLRTEATIFFGAIFTLAIVGLVRGVRWGRRLAVASSLLMLVVGIGAVLPARITESGLTGKEAPSTEVAVAQFIAIVVIALACLHVLGLYKDRFRKDWW
jgi:hypothetical protein